jgi:hypothetical protein
MVHYPVTSTTMLAAGYDEDRHLLEIVFHTNKVYQYRDVPAHIFISLMQATSKGQYFNDHIRDSFPCHEVY